MTQKTKTKPAKTLRGAALVRDMFSDPKAAYTIDEVVARMGLNGKTPKASAAAVFSVLANPARTKDPIRISMDRKTKKYALVAGWHPAPKDLPDKPAAPKAAKKKVAKAGEKKAAKPAALSKKLSAERAAATA